MVDTLLARTYVIKVAIEDDKGDYNTPDLDLLCFDLKCDPVTENEARQGTGKFEADNNVGVFTSEKGKCSFRTELLGSGAGALDPALSALLQACNFKLTTSTYTAPVSNYTDKKTISIAAYQSGKLKMMSGCSGTCIISCEAMGKPASIQFDFTGKWLGETDADLPASWTPSAQKPMKFTGFTIDTPAAKVSRYELDLGIAVEPQPDPNGTGGVACYLAHADSIIVSFDPESQLVGTWDVDGARQSQATLALVATFSNGIDKLVVTNAKGEILENPAAARNKLLVNQIKCRALLTSGDDNVSMVVSAA